MVLIRSSPLHPEILTSSLCPMMEDNASHYWLSHLELGYLLLVSQIPYNSGHFEESHRGWVPYRIPVNDTEVGRVEQVALCPSSGDLWLPSYHSARTSAVLHSIPSSLFRKTLPNRLVHSNTQKKIMTNITGKISPSPPMKSHRQGSHFHLHATWTPLQFSSSTISGQWEASLSSLYSESLLPRTSQMSSTCHNIFLSFRLNPLSPFS